MTTVSNTPNFEGILEEMKIRGMKIPDQKVLINIPDAKTILFNAMKYFVGLEGREMVWIEEYDKVSEWLQNNSGRGLFLYGTCGRGKSVLCRYAIPAILMKYSKKITYVFDVQDINKDIDSVLEKHIISLDDIGTEELSVKYGEKRMAFAEIIDSAEKHGKLVIISSNLNETELKSRYGDRIFDRILSTTKRVLFQGESFRK